MYGSQIKRIIDSDIHMKNAFGGIYPRDKIPSQLIPNKAYVINSDPAASLGQHWLLAYVNRDGRGITWFDSFGESPSHYQINNLPPVIEMNTKSLQGPLSKYCGLFVIYVYYYLTRGIALGKIIRTFFKDSLLNDRLVVNFVKQKFKFYPSIEMPDAAAVTPEKLFIDLMSLVF